MTTQIIAAIPPPKIPQPFQQCMNSADQVYRLIEEGLRPGLATFKRELQRL
jgi:hypothetical protein